MVIFCAMWDHTRLQSDYFKITQQIQSRNPQVFLQFSRWYGSLPIQGHGLAYM